MGSRDMVLEAVQGQAGQSRNILLPLLPSLDPESHADLSLRDVKDVHRYKLVHVGMPTPEAHKLAGPFPSPREPTHWTVSLLSRTLSFLDPALPSEPQGLTVQCHRCLFGILASLISHRFMCD